MAPLPKNISVDYGNVPIKKLPDGKAFGADDLARWSLRRTMGYSGDGGVTAAPVSVKCQSCGEVSQILAKKVPKGKKYRQTFECRSCGEKKARVQNKNRARKDRKMKRKSN